MIESKTILESENFIVLDKYERLPQSSGYQSEADMERELIDDLKQQGYDKKDINSQTALLLNLKEQLERLNNVKFSSSEWKRLVEEYIDKLNDGIVEKTRKIQDDHIYDFVFEDGHIQNICLIDKKDIAKNSLQVINQFEQTGSSRNRYDVTILVNGLPLV